MSKTSELRAKDGEAGFDIGQASGLGTVKIGTGADEHLAVKLKHAGLFRRQAERGAVLPQRFYI